MKDNVLGWYRFTLCYWLSRKRLHFWLWVGRVMPSRMRYAAVLWAAVHVTTLPGTSGSPDAMTVIDMLKLTPGGEGL